MADQSYAFLTADRDMDCRLCQSLGGQIRFKISDQTGMEAHFLMHSRQIENLAITMSEMFETYFLKIDDPTKERENCKSQSASNRPRGQVKEDRQLLNMQQVRFRCMVIVKKRLHNDRISCAICNSSIKTVFRGGKKTSLYNALDHACSHLNARIFSCKLCFYKSKTRHGIRKHLLRVHKYPSSVGNYDDLSDSFANEIMEKFRRCFDHDLLKLGDARKSEKAKTNKRQHQGVVTVKQGNVKVKSAPINKAILTRRAKSDLLITRQEYAIRLIKKHSKNGRIECQLCFKKIMCQCRNGQGTVGRMSEIAMQHVHTHLKKFLYHCQRCVETKITLPQLYAHMRTSHGTTTGGYGDRCDEYHDEIMTQLTKCYKKEVKSQVHRSRVQESVASRKKVSFLVPSTTAKVPSMEAKKVVEKKEDENTPLSKSARGFDQIRSRRNPRPRMQTRANAQSTYECQSCGWTTKYDGLMISHIKAMHAVAQS